MTVQAVAFLPVAPGLVPAISRGASGDLDPVREACAAALDRVLTLDLPVVISGPRDTAGGVGSARGFGVDLSWRINASGGRLPWAQACGAWLLLDHLWRRCGRAQPGQSPDAHLWRRCGRAQPGQSPEGHGPDDQGPLNQDPDGQGPAITATGPQPPDHDCVLLAMGDGSISRSTQAPGFLDDRAEAWDATVAAGLARGDLDDVDWALGAELQAAGVPVWRAAPEGPWDAALHADAAPQGVGLLVASWVRP